MGAPRLILLVGPNGAGKTSLYETFIARRFPELPFVNADRLATEHWPGEEEQHAYEAAQLAAAHREALLHAYRSFVAETVFSHPSKVELIERAITLGYEVWLLVIHVDPEVAVARVAYRVAEGGHAVPEEKIRKRHVRLLDLIAKVLPQVNRAILFDNNTSGHGHIAIATVSRGRVQWGGFGQPDWTQHLLRKAGLL
ncbi:zeta toxin family protein [Nitrococcus mobilis]|uniref:Zeta toxin domain-containing protein n=1 Tax=Nitrococcus mobilis Nb-231 TaxID=314278 RepID=A4BRK8_9GAMM|nr:zeta toxin family protein [Nitrococcus mobilis]EAR21579.1 hypothetical protein NB231_02393 [Nitrococcus mobilis Nb-231]